MSGETFKDRERGEGPSDRTMDRIVGVRKCAGMGSFEAGLWRKLASCSAT